jgi:hypothetical protein
MSVGPDPAEQETLRTRITAARRLAARADLRLTGAIDDLFRPDESRLDERTRLALHRAVTAVVGQLEDDLRTRAAERLRASGAGDAADRLRHRRGEALERLTRCGVLRDRPLMDELFAQVRCDLLAEGLPAAAGEPDQASILVRLSEVDDVAVAGAARALLEADTERRAALARDGMPAGVLTAERHHQVLWWVAAAMRDGDPACDHAIVDAARQALAEHDEGRRPEALAIRLAAAIDARPGEVGELLIEALGDRRLTVFAAVLARAIGFECDAVLPLVLEPEGDRLWLALRAAGQDREAIARIALALAQADGRRDIEAFADALDAIAAVPADAAREALAPLALPRDLRLAIDALARETGR